MFSTQHWLCVDSVLYTEGNDLRNLEKILEEQEEHKKRMMGTEEMAP